MRLDGRNAVITGGSRGIGAAVAEALVRSGAHVLIGSRDRERGETTARRIAEEGAEVIAEVVDVSAPDSVDRFADVAHARLGSVDILVNNAGVAHSAPLARIEWEAWNRVLGVNATGTYLCTRAFVPGMIERGWGRVVNVASTAGLDGGKYIAAYAASKHAVVGFTRSVAEELHGTGVTMNAVCPGYVDTDLTRASVERIARRTGRTQAEARELLASGNASGRLLEPDEVAEVVVGLCAEEASEIHGQIIVVNGGEE